MDCNAMGMQFSWFLIVEIRVVVIHNISIHDAKYPCVLYAKTAVTNCWFFTARFFARKLTHCPDLYIEFNCHISDRR